MMYDSPIEAFQSFDLLLMLFSLDPTLTIRVALFSALLPWTVTSRQS